MKKILLINQGKGSENIGDKAISETFKRILINTGCSVDLAGFSQTKSQSMPEVKTIKKADFSSKIRAKVKLITPSFFIWLFKYRKKIKIEFEEITKNAEHDLVIIGGGQLIKTKSVFVYALFQWVRLVKKNLGCPIVIAGVGADNNFSNLEKMIYRYNFRFIDKIYVRDYDSINILQENFEIKADYFPDIVLYDNNSDHDTNQGNRDKLLVSIFSYTSYINNTGKKISKSEYYKYWTKLINDNIDDLKLNLGYTTITDKKETYEFANYLANHTQIEYTIVNNDELDCYKNVLSTTKKVISGRMHGMILGLNNGCHVIPFVVSPKIRTFNSEWVMQPFDSNQVRKTIDNAITSILK